jgi:hypothetical protein
MQAIRAAGVAIVALLSGCSAQEQSADVNPALKGRTLALSCSLTNGFDVLSFDRQVKMSVPLLHDSESAQRYVDFYEQSILSAPIFTPDCKKDINLLYVRFNGFIDVLKHVSIVVSEVAISNESRLSLVLKVANHLENEANRIRMCCDEEQAVGRKAQIIARSVAKNVMTYREGWLSLHIDTGVWLEKYIETLPQDEVRDVMRRIEKVMGRYPMWCKSRK